MIFIRVFSNNQCFRTKFYHYKLNNNYEKVRETRGQDEYLRLWKDYFPSH